MRLEERERLAVECHSLTAPSVPDTLPVRQELSCDSEAPSALGELTF